MHFGGSMRRRDFILTAFGATVGWSFPALAQSTDRVRLVGLLNALTLDDPEGETRVVIFQQALQQLGWEIGRNLRIEARPGGGNTDLLRRNAAELVALAPDVILSIGSLAVGALQQATRSIPIVFVNSPDPIGAGFVQSMAHPGGNITGFSNFEYSMSGKWAELLKQVAPQTTRALVLRDPSSAAGIGQFAAVRSVAQSLGIELTAVDVRDTTEVERRVAEFARAGNGGMIVTAGGTGSHRKVFIELAARHKLPAIYPYGYYAADGGLITYGPDTHEPLKRAAGYVDRISEARRRATCPCRRRSNTS